VVASCRYPGMPFEVERSDRVYRGMLKVIMDRSQAIDMLFLVGDQIYADASADLFDSRVDRDRYTLQYRRAFTTENARALLSALPVHFAIDDHEIRDDWSGEPFEDLGFAVAEARSYLGSAREAREVGRAPRPSHGSLWYALDHTSEAAFPSFVMDSRSERQERSSGGETDTLMRKEQLRAFGDWLEAAQKEVGDTPKFVFAGQPIVPLSERFHQANGLWRNEDGFAGYPHSLDAIVDHILASGVRNLVFVGGDKHLSCASELWIPDRERSETRRVWQIVASGLYAPLPFANSAARDFAWGVDRELPLPRHSIGYRSSFLTAAPSHFVRVGVSQDRGSWQLSLSAFDPEGSQIASISVPLSSSA